MTLKEKILLDLKEVSNPNVLEFIFNFLQLVKQKDILPYKQGSLEHLLSFAGILDDEEAQTLKDMINKEFSKIEGEW